MLILISLRLFQIELPPWTDIVKTARFKELAPYDPDWYYVRAGIFTLSPFSILPFTLYLNVIPCVCVFGFVYLSMWFLKFQYFAASMARKIYLRGGLGVGAFKRIYGGSQRNGSRPPHFCESSGAIARHILQQLQNMNIIDIDPKGLVWSIFIS